MERKWFVFKFYSFLSVFILSVMLLLMIQRIARAQYRKGAPGQGIEEIPAEAIKPGSTFGIYPGIQSLNLYETLQIIEIHDIETDTTLANISRWMHLMHILTHTGEDEFCTRLYLRFSFNVGKDKWVSDIDPEIYESLIRSGLPDEAYMAVSGMSLTPLQKFVLGYLFLRSGKEEYAQRLISPVILEHKKESDMGTLDLNPVEIVATRVLKWNLGMRHGEKAMFHALEAALRLELIDSKGKEQKSFNRDYRQSIAFILETLVVYCPNRKQLEELCTWVLKLIYKWDISPGDNHAACRIFLAAWEGSGQYSKALDIRVKLFENYDFCYGISYPYVCNALKTGMLQYKLGMSIQAITTLRVLTAKLEPLRNQLPMTCADALISLAECYILRGEITKSEQLLDFALDLLRSQEAFEKSFRCVRLLENRSNIRKFIANCI